MELGLDVRVLDRASDDPVQVNSLADSSTVEDDGGRVHRAGTPISTRDSLFGLFYRKQISSHLALSRGKLDLCTGETGKEATEPNSRAFVERKRRLLYFLLRGRVE